MRITPDALADAYRHGRIAAITGDALAFFASPAIAEQAAAALDRGEFKAWPADEQREAAAEIRALAECYSGATITYGE